MSNKTLTFVIIVLVVIAGLVYWNKHSNKAMPVEDANSLSAIDSQTQADTTTQMQSDLDSIDTSAGIDADLNSVDTKVQSL